MSFGPATVSAFRAACAPTSRRSTSLTQRADSRCAARGTACPATASALSHRLPEAEVRDAETQPSVRILDCGCKHWKHGRVAAAGGRGVYAFHVGGGLRRKAASSWWILRERPAGIASRAQLRDSLQLWHSQRQGENWKRARLSTATSTTSTSAQSRQRHAIRPRRPLPQPSQNGGSHP
jgi:hypothetical protein